MKRKSKKVISLLILFLFLLGCATSTTTLRKISIGMNKEAVISQLDEPTVARGSLVNKYGQVIEVWEYRLALPTTDSAGTIIGKSAFTLITLGIGAKEFRGERKDYWLYFYDDKLVQWGQAGDWRREADRIYEFNFNPQPALTK